jgi:hypothetical protein
MAMIAADWPQFLGPNRDGHSAETGLVDAWPARGPALVWEKEVGAGYSGPIVIDGSLLLFHREAENEVVTCMEAATGKPRWSHMEPTAYTDDYGKGDGPRSTPCVSGKRVYALGAEGHLFCLDLDAGRKIWERFLLKDYQVPRSFFGVATSPVVEEERLLINVGGKDAGIVAFNKETGKELWKATSQGASYSSPVCATLAGTRLVLFFTRDGLAALHPATGQLAFTWPWRSRFQASVNAATPLIVGDQVFVSASYNTGALLLEVGKAGPKEIWKSDEVLSNHYSTSIVQDRTLYGFDGRQEEGARLRSVDWKSGKVHWTKEGFGCGSMILAAGKLIILTETGELVLIEGTDREYKEKGRAKVLTFPCRAQIALANGKLYGRDERKLCCWELKK